MAYKDGFVIEYTHQGKRLSCYKCVHFDKDDKSCNKTGAYVPEIAFEKWRKCPHFELDDDWNTDEMRATAERIRAIAQRKKKPREQKKSQPANVGKKKSKPQPAAGVKKGSEGKQRGREDVWKMLRQKPGNAMMPGIKVSSPRYGCGKVKAVEGEYVTVVFEKDSKTVKFKVDIAMENGSLSIL